MRKLAQKSMKTNKDLFSIIGLALVGAGFLFFNSLFLWGDYSAERAEESLNDKTLSLKSLWPTGAYSNPVSFSKAINDFAATVNDKAWDEGVFSDQELDEIMASWKNESGYKISLSGLSEMGLAEDKVKGFIDYGSWLDGKEYSDQQSLYNDLNLVRKNYYQYSLLPSKGFDKYQLQNLKVTWARAAHNGPQEQMPLLILLLALGLPVLGGSLMFLGKKDDSKKPKPGPFHLAISYRGISGVLLGAYLIIFYVVLYFIPEYLNGQILLVDPISIFLSGNTAGQFFLYGLLYTLVVLVMGLRMLKKYRHVPYQRVRTLSVMFFQLCFAFILPEILVGLNQPYFDFKNIFPLDYDFFFESNISSLISSGKFGIFMFVWGIALFVVAVPLFTYLYGKRWYCSWVCGCGGLAETAGDPFRQLSDKSLKAWRVERITVHSVLIFSLVMTGLVLYTFFTGNSRLGFLDSFQVREVYGAWIGAGFAGVVGTGFYPLMGNRVWCRYGCPLAAYLGLVQRIKSRFRITTNGGQCISCGNCSTYCEMGIDVRWYAQRGQNIVRSSCVGCGICSAVCPRGVLKLENGPEKGRIEGEGLLG